MYNRSMAENELVSVRAIITDHAGNVLLLETREGWILPGEKSAFNNPPDEEIIQSVKHDTGLDFSANGHFTTKVESSSIHGRQRIVHYYDGQAKGKIMLDPYFINSRYFTPEDICQSKDIISSQRLVLTVYFANQKGV